MMKNKTAYPVILLWLILLATSACSKKEYLPAAIGEQLPAKDTTYTPLEEALEASPYTLFYEAWKRSGLRNELLSEENDALNYTFLVLDNEVLGEAGWNAQRIASAPVEELDELLAPYILQGNIDEQRLKQQSAGAIADSYYIVPDVFFNTNPYYYSSANAKTYFQKASLRLDDAGILAVNGTSSGIAEAIATDRGILWPVNQMISFNAKTAWDVLKDDGRFTLYTGIIEWTDAKYNDLFYNLNGYLPLEDNENRDGDLWPLVDNYYHNTPRQQGMVTYTDADDITYIDPLNTWFIPTDEAFHKAGFHNLQDLIAYNEKQGEPKPVAVAQLQQGTLEYAGVDVSILNPAFTGLQGYYATDSILDYHSMWGMRTKDYPYWNSRGTTLFFSNDLPAALNQQLQVGGMTYETNINKVTQNVTKTHYSPLKALSSTDISVPGLAVDRVHISQKDIYTLNGVIHVVDDLFQPHKIQ